MNSFFPLPLYTFLKVAGRNGGINPRKIKNLLPWLLKTIALEPLRWIEILLQDREIREHRMTSHPIFVLGFYRSGTTYLQQFLLQDDRKAHHSVFQMVFPEIMLSAERWMIPIMEFISRVFKMEDPVHRIPLSWRFPGEEDATMTTSVNEMGAQWGFFFPTKMHEYFNRYVLFENISGKEKDQWIQSFLFLINKISLASGGKQLVLKSPPNTARLKLLHTLFPDSKFVLIHRNPYEVFASNKRFWKVSQDIYTIGKTKHVDTNAIILHTYSKAMDKYIAEKNSVPPSHLMEIPYDDFVKNPLVNTQQVYENLGLGDFDYCKDKMVAFAERQTRFNRLSHTLDNREKSIVAEKWEPYFKHWGYTL